jgi:WD40 repeat protein
MDEIECPRCECTHKVTTQSFHPNFFIQKQIRENSHLSRLELDLKIELEQIFETIVNVYRDIDEAESKYSKEWSVPKMAREQTLNKMQDELNIQFRLVKIDVEKLHEKRLDMEKRANLLRDELSNFILESNQSFKLILSCFNGSLLIQDLENLSNYNFFDGKHEGRIDSVLISEDKQKLISGGLDGVIKVWDLKTGTLIKSIINWRPDLINRGIKCLLNMPHANKILVASTISDIQVLDLNSFEFDSNLRLVGHLRMVKCLEFLSNNLLLSGSLDNTIKIWVINTRECIKTIEGDCCVFELKKISENKFVCGYQNHILKIWSVLSKSELKLECTTNVPDKSCLIQMEVNLELNFIISCTPDRIYIWKLDDLKYVTSLRSYNFLQVRSFVILPNKCLLAAFRNNTIQMWCLKDFICLKILNNFSFCNINQIKLFYPYFFFIFN